ncbi:glycosyltransferase family 2 protein [Epilithonimonas mollis]|uniref:Glycosyltransferase involved in cell wall bisynthesis n=1 Tax=Epilithonimonas mollis TaxID=216903 RepID=A0A1M6RR52_9FLAO|nr:glycosyltransferase family A protein [Epilithonimonas mollis]SHK34991.1 Glycosyltransferase involved in cell wall bisynthesis [Epilithonimonas mollis]
MNKTLTVFTPTYNRAYLLPKLYQSLCNQTSHDFIWLIIDDGSSDNTREIVHKWIKDNKIEIIYHYKENGGMHTGHNAAYKLINTELNVCIDSDDQMPVDAVKSILLGWDSIPDKNHISGFIGLDSDSEGNIIGTLMPKDISLGSYNDLFKKHKAKGDKKFVLRTEEVKRYPLYPEFKKEKLVPLGTLYILMGKNKPFVFLNKVLCIVEYQPEGSSHTILKQYKQSPKGFAYARKIHIKNASDIGELLRAYVHLVSAAIFSKDYLLAFRGVNPVISLLMYPFGALLNLYIRFKIKK